MVLALAATVVADPPVKGPYEVSRKDYDYDKMDTTNKKIRVYYPTGSAAEGSKFPLISYSHGASGGGLFLIGYDNLLETMASFGFVVGAQLSCSFGCNDGGWLTYYKEQLKVIDFAKNMSAQGTEEWAKALDLSTGVGVAGHSMGGMAVGYNSVQPNVGDYDIRAALMHCPATTVGDVRPKDFTVPIAIFTGTNDSPKPKKEMYDEITFSPRTFRDQTGLGHLEPVLQTLLPENPWLGYYTAAWFKIYLNGDKGEYYNNYYKENNPDALCSHAAMDDCQNVH